MHRYLTDHSLQRSLFQVGDGDTPSLSRTSQTNRQQLYSNVIRRYSTVSSHVSAIHLDIDEYNFQFFNFSPVFDQSGASV